MPITATAKMLELSLCYGCRGQSTIMEGRELMQISISLLEDTDAETLFHFEMKNRLFFEKTVPSRGDDYYSWDVFLDKHQQLLEEQKSGQSHFYLIRNDAGEIVGRINLVDIDKTTSAGEVGFRVGAEYTGKGIGNKALNLLLKADSDLQKIHGKTTTVNHASQKVLEKNGFKQVRIDDEEFLMNGHKIRFVHYLRERK